jgi:hypothetical protein
MDFLVVGAYFSRKLIWGSELKVIVFYIEGESLYPGVETKVFETKGDLIAGVKLYRHFQDVRVVTTHIDVARRFGVDYFENGEVIDVSDPGYYNLAPEPLRVCHKQEVENSLKVQCIEERETIESVDEVDIDEILCSEGVYVVHIPTGKRKTKGIALPLFKKAVLQGTKCLAITPLISICREFHRRVEEDTGLRVAYYDNLIKDDLYAAGMVSTINSSNKDVISRHGAKSEVLIVEEFCACLDTITENEELKHVRVSLINNLLSLIRSTRVVVLLDADFNDKYIDFIKEANRNIRLIDMKPDYSGVAIQLMAEDIFTARIIEAVHSKKKVLITTDSKKAVQVYTKLLSGYGRVLDIHADNKGLEPQKKFLMSPNDRLADVDILIYSPVMGRSISIERSHFTAHFGLFNGILTPVSCIQQLRRDRTATEFHICLRGKAIPLGKDSGYDDVGGVVESIRELNNYLRRSIGSSLVISMRYLKFDVHYSTSCSDVIHSKKLRDVKRSLAEEYRASIKESTVLSNPNTETLFLRDDLTIKEVYDREAASIRKLTGEISDESIDFYARGKGTKRMVLLDIVNLTLDKALDMDLRESELIEFDKTHFGVLKNKYDYIFKKLNTNGYVQFSSRDAIKIVNHLKRIKTINKTGIVSLCPKKKYDDKAAVRELRKLLKALGLVLKCRKNSQKEQVWKVSNYDDVCRFYKYKYKRDLHIHEI